MGEREKKEKREEASQERERVGATISMERHFLGATANLPPHQRRVSERRAEPAMSKGPVQPGKNQARAPPSALEVPVRTCQPIHPRAVAITPYPPQ